MNLLNNLFNTFKTKEISYCVLHSYENLPEKVNSDVDICIDISEEELDKIIYEVSSKEGVRIIQKLYYDIPNLISYDVVDLDNLFKVAQIDCYRDYLGISWLFIPAREFINDRKNFKDFYTPSPYKEFLYILAKRAYKRQIMLQHIKRLNELYLNNSQEVDVIVKKYFGSKGICLLKKLLVSDVDGEKIKILKKLRGTFVVKQCLFKPWKWLLIFYFFIFRLIYRVIHPTGMLICFVSPDGGGKSTIIAEASKKLLCGIHKTISFHWRPGLLPQLRTLFGISKLNNQSNVPHTGNKRNKISSFLRWLYYFSDYILGYYFTIIPFKISKTAVLMDRYYYDIIVDPVRYGFNLPKWLLKLPFRIIPKPDLTIYLDNEPEELFKRKQELPIEELRRQVNAWREFIPSLPNPRIVMTDKPLEEVVNEVTRLILERRAEMTRKMLKIEPEESRYLWSTDLTDYIALPSKKNCRWIIPSNPKFAKIALNLYLPYSFKGRAYKRVMKFLSAKGFLKVLKFNKVNIESSSKSEGLKNCIANVFKRNDLLLALSTGTPSPFRKITAMILSSDGTILGYAKIGETQLAIERIKNEAKVLKVLGEKLKVIGNESIIPKCLYEGEIENAYILIQTPPPIEVKSREGNFNEDYARLLSILIKNSIVKKKFVDSEFYKNLKQGIETYPISYRDILKKGLKYLEKSIGEKEITFSISHGDFAPWNMLWSKNKENVFLFDWESASLESPAGIDLIHFLFQTGFLLNKLRDVELMNFCLNYEPYKMLNDHLGFPLLDIKYLFLVYLLKMSVDEDKEQLLSDSAVERRKLLKLLISL